MPICADNSGGHPDQGMTLADMNATQLVAARRDEIIMFPGHRLLVPALHRSRSSDEALPRERQE